jgi:NAD(P)-dependent dehydrogenase (short-subunit alcohol dehydrogenase family)
MRGGRVTRFEGRTALVTGAASGIGRATVERLLSEGATVVGTDVQAESDGGPAGRREGYRFLTADVRDEAAMAAAVAEAVDAGGRLDGVVNAAGVAGAGPVHLLDLAEWDRVVSINLTGTFVVAKVALAQMLAQDPRPNGQRGAVVTIASIEGLEGTAGGSCYNASKGGVVLLTRNMAIDYGPSGIRVNAVCPGFVDTPMTGLIFGMDGMEAVADGYRDEHALRRIGQADEIAAATAYLLSDDASFVSGAAIPVDGGYTAGRDHGITRLMGLS